MVANYTLYKIAQFIAMNFPLKLGYLIAVIISDIHYVFANIDRFNVKQNLKAIFPEKTNREISRIRIRTFRNFAKYLVDFFRFQIIDENYIKKYIKVENLHYFDEALAKGKGMIIVSAHLGNWELGAVVVAQMKYPLWVVALPHKKKSVDDLFNSQRESKGIKVIPLGKAVRACLNLLKNNEMVALVGDRDFTGKGTVSEIFGKPAFFPNGIAAFSLMTGTSVVPAFMVRNPDDTFTLKIDKPLEISPSGDNEKDMIAINAQYIKLFEKYIRKYPDQWYMFRRFWIEP
ncbi:MAG: lysophospholipid acyltransferase family protein [Candidatus Omnitrophica bacterium]|nr:lysophospholipid acyltransferase family protein [Candidatus Omnitrophota bacterium]